MGPLAWVVLGGLVLPLAGGPPPRPTAVAVQVRMLLLRPGMTEDRVTGLLGVEGWIDHFGVAGHHTSARVGPDHTFVACYRHDPGRKGAVLSWAELRRGKEAVARVPVGQGAWLDPNGRPAIDPAVVDEAIRAVQSGAGWPGQGGVGPRKK